MNKKVSFLAVCLFFWAPLCLAYEDGTKNGFFHRPIARHTGSNMCHVAIVLHQDGPLYFIKMDHCTSSRWTIVLHQDGKEYVYESALGGVQRTPLNTFFSRSGPSSKADTILFTHHPLGVCG